MWVVLLAFFVLALSGILAHEWLTQAARVWRDGPFAPPNWRTLEFVIRTGPWVTLAFSAFAVAALLSRWWITERHVIPTPVVGVVTLMLVAWLAVVVWRAEQQAFLCAVFAREDVFSGNSACFFCPALLSVWPWWLVPMLAAAALAFARRGQEQTFS